LSEQKQHRKPLWTLLELRLVRSKRIAAAELW